MYANLKNDLLKLIDSQSLGVLDKVNLSRQVITIFDHALLLAKFEAEVISLKNAALVATITGHIEAYNGDNYHFSLEIDNLSVRAYYVTLTPSENLVDINGKVTKLTNNETSILLRIMAGEGLFIAFPDRPHIAQDISIIRGKATCLKELIESSKLDKNNKSYRLKF